MLDKEIAYFNDHQAEWARRHPGKFVLVMGTKALGFFDTGEEAQAEGARRFASSPYLVRSVDAAEGAATIRLPADQEALVQRLVDQHAEALEELAKY